MILEYLEMEDLVHIISNFPKSRIGNEICFDSILIKSLPPLFIMSLHRFAYYYSENPLIMKWINSNSVKKNCAYLDGYSEKYYYQFTQYEEYSNFISVFDRDGYIYMM